MKKIALCLVILLLIFGSLTATVGQIANGSTIKEQVKEKRTASLPEMSLKSYVPEKIKGFTKTESSRPDDTTLKVWGADSGWLESWEEPNLPYDVTFHDLLIDVYKFDTKAKAKARTAIIEEIKSYGEVSVETLRGLPLMVTTWKHDYKNSESADAFIGYYQDNLVIFVEVSKQVMDGSVASAQLLKEGKQVFRAIMEQDKEKSDKKEAWMKNSDQKDSASSSNGSSIHDIYAEATLIRDNETRLPTKIKIENTSSATWKKLKATINPGFFGGGYTYSYPIVGPHTEITIGVRQFTKGNGERFNPYATKIKELKLVAHVNGSRDFKIFKG